MTPTIHIECDASKQFHDPRLMSASDPDKATLATAMARLKNVSACITDDDE